MSQEKRGPLHSVYGKRLLRSYICVLLPVFLVFTLCTSNLFAQQRKRVDANIQAEVDQIACQLSLQWQALELQSLYIGLKEEFSAARMLKNDYNTVMGIGYLKDLRNTCPLLADVVLHYAEDPEQFYTAEGICRVSTYGNARMLTAQGKARLSQLLQNMEGPRFFRLPTEKGNDDWVLRVPLRLAHGADALAVQFFLQIDALVREQIALQEARCLTISCVGEGDVHYLQEDGRYIRVPAPDGAQRVFSVELERYGMTIALSIAPKTLYHAVENSRRVTLLTLSLLLLAVMWAAVYFSERHSRPLRILAAHYVSEQNLPGRLDELSMIGKLLDVTREENRHMRGVVADARGTLCQQALLLLFHGVLDEDETLNRMLSLNGLEVRSGGYLVAIVDAQPASIDLLSALPECELNCRMTLYHRSVLVVLLDYVEEETVRKLRSAHAARMVEACENAGLPAPRVSFSRFCPSLSQCSQAYIEAVFAYKVGLSGMAGGFLCFDELLSFDLPSAGFPAQEEETFVRALAAMDKKRVEAALQVLLTFIASDAHCDETRIALRVTLLQRAMHAFLEQDAVLDDISGMDPTDGERFEKQLGAFLRRVLSENAVDGAYERVLACIQEHYTDSQLTLAVVSQRVGLSAAYISRLFHNKGEKKYIDYLTDLRVQEAMRLLCQTNLQVKEITQRVGYWDTVNFQKKFKAITGLNPSEYRKTMQGGDPHDFGNAGDAGQGGI